MALIRVLLYGACGDVGALEAVFDPELNALWFVFSKIMNLDQSCETLLILFAVFDLVLEEEGRTHAGVL